MYLYCFLSEHFFIPFFKLRNTRGDSVSPWLPTVGSSPLDTLWKLWLLEPLPSWWGAFWRAQPKLPENISFKTGSDSRNTVAWAVLKPWNAKMQVANIQSSTGIYWHLFCGSQIKRSVGTINRWVCLRPIFSQGRGRNQSRARRVRKHSRQGIRVEVNN